MSRRTVSDFVMTGPRRLSSLTNGDKDHLRQGCLNLPLKLLTFHGIEEL